MNAERTLAVMLVVSFQVMTSSCLANQKNVSIFELTQEEIKKLKLVYYSDYFSME